MRVPINVSNQFCGKMARNQDPEAPFPSNLDEIYIKKQEAPAFLTRLL